MAIFTIYSGVEPIIGIDECDNEPNTTVCAVEIRQEIFKTINDQDWIFWSCIGTYALILLLLTWFFLKFINRQTYFYAFVTIYIVVLAEIYLIRFSLLVANPELIGSAILGLFAAAFFFFQMIVNIETNKFEQEKREENNRIIQKRDFTLKMVLESRSDKTLNWHRSNLYSILPPEQTMNHRDMIKICSQKNRFKYRSQRGGDPDKAPVYDSIVYILNYYEFIATGIHAGVIDRKIVEKTIGPIIYRYTKKVRLMMDKLIEENKKSLVEREKEQGNDTFEPKDYTYSDLEKLINEWIEQGVWFARDQFKGSPPKAGWLGRLAFWQAKGT